MEFILTTCYLFQSDKMNNDVNVHVCDTCKKSYTYKRNLIRHIVSTHVNKEYFPCNYEYCRIEFKRKDYLRRHLIKTHKLSSDRVNNIMKVGWKYGLDLGDISGGKLEEFKANKMSVDSGRVKRDINKCDANSNDNLRNEGESSSRSEVGNNGRDAVYSDDDSSGRSK